MPLKLKPLPPLTLQIIYNRQGCIAWQVIEFPEIEIRVHLDSRGSFRQIFVKGLDIHTSNLKVAYNYLLERKKCESKQPQPPVRKVLVSKKNKGRSMSKRRRKQGNS